MKQEKKEIVYEFICSELYVPMKEKELAIMLRVERADRGALSEALQSLLAENRIVITKKGRYLKAEEQVKEELIGTFIAKEKGFGFIEVEGQEEDYFVPKNEVNGAFHQDIVAFALLKDQRGSRKEVKVTKIVERTVKRIVGIYQQNKNYGFVVPDNKRITSDIFISLPRTKGAVNGHKVVVELTSYGNEKQNPEGKVIEILGHVNDPGVDILSIVSDYDLPTEFGERVLNQAVRVAKEVSEADRNNRLDLRDIKMVTIDGADAKDLDDAVHVRKKGELYELGVHIADVTNYVQENSALDHEALLRGTSVYLVDRVIPMLPHVLSNGICSLNQGEDRLSLSCVMTIDGNGGVVDYEIVESVINVNRRMTYTDVSAILDGDESLRNEYGEFVEMFEQMKIVADALRNRRKMRGTIDFDFPESKIMLDELGRPTHIMPYERNVASKIIEDFMLAANETVAEHFYWMEIPFVYRVHETPDPERIEKLSTFLKNFGYAIKMGREELHPKELQKLLDSIEGTNEEALISRLTLRSMKQAKYTITCDGHFGLACKYYCHFTSPIRRYPDLQIHRIIKETLRGKMGNERKAHYEACLPDVTKHTSSIERRAAEAERETIKLKKAEYMEERIGRQYTGVISSITSWGIYVELPNTIEGMIHVSSLEGGYYEYNDKNHEMVCASNKCVYQLGQTVTIIVKGVDKTLRTIDFLIASMDHTEGESNGER